MQDGSRSGSYETVFVSTGSHQEQSLTVSVLVDVASLGHSLASVRSHSNNVSLMLLQLDFSGPVLVDTA